MASRYVSTGGCVECGKSHTASYRRAILDRRGVIAANGDALLEYKLHRDDYAAAIAYCQALDMARGRTPQLATPLPPQPGLLTHLPPWLAELRKQEEQWNREQAERRARLSQPTNGN